MPVTYPTDTGEIFVGAPKQSFFDNPDPYLFGDFFNRSLLSGDIRPKWSIGRDDEEDKDEQKVTDPKDTAGRKKVDSWEGGGGAPGYGEVPGRGPFGAVGRDAYDLDVSQFGIDRVDPSNITDLPGDIGRALGIGKKGGNLLTGLISSFIPGANLITGAGKVLGGLLGQGTGYDKGAAIDSSLAAIAQGLATAAPYGTPAEYSTWESSPVNEAEWGALRAGLPWGGPASGVDTDVSIDVSDDADDSDYGIGDLGDWGGDVDGGPDADAGGDDGGGWGGMGDVGDGYGFKEGGFTGYGDDGILQTDMPVEGPVHEGELVLSAELLQQLPPELVQKLLMMMNKGDM